MPIEMQYSKTAAELAETFEGCRLQSYPDIGGVWTIGYGHTSGVHPGMICTPQRAIEWLDADMKIAAACVNRYVSVTLTQNEFDALCDFVFNLGCGDFARSTLLRLLNRGEYAEAANQFDLWDHCGGKVVAGLLRRREAEEETFSDGLSTT